MFHPALEAAGDESISEKGGGAGVRIRKTAEPDHALEGETGVIRTNDM